VTKLQNTKLETKTLGAETWKTARIEMTSMQKLWKTARDWDDFDAETLENCSGLT
jgi:hypothetical protein